MVRFEHGLAPGAAIPSLLLTAAGPLMLGGRGLRLDRQHAGG